MKQFYERRTQTVKSVSSKTSTSFAIFFFAKGPDLSIVEYCSFHHFIKAMVFDIMFLLRLSMLPYAILALRPGVPNFPDGGLGNGGL